MLREDFCVRDLVTDSHQTGGHVHETHGHRSASEGGEKREEEGKAKVKGIAFI